MCDHHLFIIIVPNDWTNADHQNNETNHELISTRVKKAQHN
jgi:hypothetical protein